MLSEIGSNFWLNPNQILKDLPLGTPEQFGVKGNDYVWLSTGRSAIKYVLKTIEERTLGIKKVAVLPSFTCDTVFEPFLEAGYEVFYYPVGRDLKTTSDSILETVLKHDASIVLFHRYFGFDTLDGQVDKMCEILRGLGKFSIEDCTQCLYSSISRAQSDFTVGSIRKWTGTPDGGFAVCRNAKFEGKPNQADIELEQAKIKASFAKYRFLFEHAGYKEDMLEMYREAESILNNQKQIYAISKMTSMVQANLNRRELESMRIENYNTLVDHLNSHVKPILSFGKEKVVPLYLPVLVEERAALQKQLVSNSIYAPVVWPKDEKQFTQCDGAENAYEHLLCIPIDQRYDADDMNRIKEVINSYYIG